MAGFKTHISTSTFIGIGYGAVAYTTCNVPLPTCLLAGGLCSVSGMLPDLDSNSGVPLRESIAFAAAVVPMMLVHRLQHMGARPETIILAGAVFYLLIRFGVSKLLKWYTVHRGMFHSLPAAIVAGELAFLLCTADTLELRLYKAGGVFVGYMSHLILDEIWSIKWQGGRWQLKKSFGTAVKFWGRSMWGNLSVYVKLLLMTYIVLHEPAWADQFANEVVPGRGPQTAHRHLPGEDHAEHERVAAQAGAHAHEFAGDRPGIKMEATNEASGDLPTGMVPLPGPVAGETTGPVTFSPNVSNGQPRVASERAEPGKR